MKIGYSMPIFIHRKNSVGFPTLFFLIAKIDITVLCQGGEGRDHIEGVPHLDNPDQRGSNLDRALQGILQAAVNRFCESICADQNGGYCSFENKYFVKFAAGYFSYCYQIQFSPTLLI